MSQDSMTVNANSALRSMLDGMRAKDVANATKKEVSVQDNSNRSDFQAIVAARVNIMHPEGEVYNMAGRNFKVTDNLPIRIAPGLGLSLRFESKRKDGTWGKEIFQLSAEGCLSRRIWNPTARKYEFIECGSGSLETLSAKKPVMVTRSTKVAGTTVEEEVEAQLPAIPYGDNKFLASHAFVGFLTLRVEKPKQVTVTYLVYNSAPFTIARNRLNYIRDLTKLAEQVQQAPTDEAKKQLVSGEVPHLKQEGFLLRTDQLSILETGNTLFKAYVVDESPTPAVVDDQPETTDAPAEEQQGEISW